MSQRHVCPRHDFTHCRTKLQCPRLFATTLPLFLPKYTFGWFFPLKIFPKSLIFFPKSLRFFPTVCCIAVRLRKGSSRKSGRDSAEKKEPVTPSSNRPTRERKVVERYSAPSVLLQGLPHLKLCQLKRVVVLSLKIFPMVLYGLEYAHAISHIKEALVEAMPRTKLELIFADVMCSIINPLEDHRKSDGFGYLGSCSSVNSLSVATGTRCSLGGLIWDLLEGRRMEDYLLLWIGPDNSTFSNVVLTFNGCEIDMMQQRNN
ncbi:hypothetical protein ES319_D04G128500v1 [Gossypium barbadense]|uniref:Uncharacterized protein n=2 Tax=Gossypium TaxID=3633 RepID=A0A5J5RVI5_GOSBA|nr:hypothetical protein ES319_D04G128500v1 [Gossypium barbadense]TYG73879.1 hypothetical protein ES288_D04G137000v1 [Gossypium darwinii]